MYRIGVLLLLTCLTLVTVDSEAAAEPTSAGAPPGYDQTIDTALQEFEAGNFAEARSQFLKAHAIFPNARTLRALGKAEYELKNYRQAVGYLEQALESKVRPLTPEQRGETQRLLDSARGYLGRYFIDVRPPDAKLLLDGTPVSLGDRGSLVLNVGDHVLSIEAEGYLPERRQLRVIGGGTERLSIELQPVPPPAAPLPAVALDSSDASSSAAAVPQTEARPLRKKWWLWTGVVAVVAGAAVAGVLLAKREPKTEFERTSSGVTIKVPADLGSN